MRLIRRVDDAPVDRIAHRVVEALGVGPGASVDRGELTARHASIIVANRGCLIGRLGDDEDPIVGNRPRRVDDERAGELRVEARAHVSVAASLRRKRHVTLPFSQRRPVLVGSRLPASERDVTRRPRQQDERIDCRTALAESADDERIVGRIPNHDVDRRPGPHPEQRCGNCGRLSFFGERRDG